MLLDRSLLVQEGSAYRVTGPVEALEVPETLHAFIAVQLDGLSSEERQLLQDAAGLGKTFTKDALAALAGADAEIEPLLTALARKEVLGVFFFSSRRRHTRYWRDWSSDVCSSDLTASASSTRSSPRPSCSRKRRSCCAASLPWDRSRSGWRWKPWTRGSRCRSTRACCSRDRKSVV